MSDNDNTAANAAANTGADTGTANGAVTGTDTNAAPAVKGRGEKNSTGVKPQADPNYDASRDKQALKAEDPKALEEGRRADGSRHDDSRELPEATVAEMEAGRNALKKHVPVRVPAPAADATETEKK